MLLDDAIDSVSPGDADSRVAMAATIVTTAAIANRKAFAATLWSYLVNMKKTHIKIC